MPCKIVILGAGISGLAAGWFLKQKYGKAVDITILEKSSRVGGWIQTEQKEGFLFEKGPRSCRTQGNGRATLELIESLGLQKEVVVAHTSAHQRYLYHNCQLHPFPTSFLKFPFSPLMKGWLKAAWRDWSLSGTSSQDQTIEAFFHRHIGPEWTERFIDPLVAGIYAGDISKLSVKSCFPLFFQWEEQYGSLLKGAIRSPKKKSSLSSFVTEMEKKSLFSFKTGMETLPRALAQQLEAEIRLNAEVMEIQEEKVLLSDGQWMESDIVISTLPPQELYYATVAIVNFGFHKQVLNRSGFGYLIPRKEKEQALGVVFDSCVFPEQSQGTRLTVMLGGTRHPEVANWNDHQCLSIAKETIDRHLGVSMVPDCYSITIAKKAIPQFEVGHDEWIKKMRMNQKRVYRIGSAFSGVAVNDCIAEAKKLADNVAVC
jgi:protoporphyrinogen/coproporphyrinogen III oxidase